MHYLNLDLPKNPSNLSSQEILNKFQNKPTFESDYYEIFDPLDILSTQLLSKFDEIKLNPKNVVVFNTRPNSTIDSRCIHSDITYNHESKCWENIIFAIHYELENSTNKFYWWDMGSDEKIYPPDKLLYPMDSKILYPYKQSSLIKLNGIHYGHRLKIGHSENNKIINEHLVCPYFPTLIRTDVPHSTAVQSTDSVRLGISIRFDESKFKSWNEVLTFFDPYKI